MVITGSEHGMVLLASKHPKHGLILYGRPMNQLKRGNSVSDFFVKQVVVHRSLTDVRSVVL